MVEFRWRNYPDEDGTSRDWRKLVRVGSSIGWAVNGIFFEYQGGSRSGILVDNDGREMGLDDVSIANRNGHWQDVVEPGDYIIEVSGNQLPRGPTYLCHTLRLHFASGRMVCFASQHHPWKGDEFSFSVNQPFLVDALVFDRILGFQYCRGQRTSIHLPVTLAMAEYLPPVCRAKLALIRSLLLDSGRVSDEMTFWFILSFATGNELLDG